MVERVPRVWNTGDPEPDEDGLKLRDRDGDVWVQQEPTAWSCNGDDDYAVDWDSALNNAPLTEVLPAPEVDEPRLLLGFAVPEHVQARKTPKGGYDLLCRHVVHEGGFPGNIFSPHDEDLQTLVGHWLRDHAHGAPVDAGEANTTSAGVQAGGSEGGDTAALSADFEQGLVDVLRDNPTAFVETDARSLAAAVVEQFRAAGWRPDNESAEGWARRCGETAKQANRYRAERDEARAKLDEAQRTNVEVHQSYDRARVARDAENRRAERFKRRARRDGEAFLALRAEIRAVLDESAELGDEEAAVHMPRIRAIVDRDPAPLPDSETERASVAEWKAAYEQKLADFAKETLRTSELTRERDELRRQLDAFTPATERYAEGEQVEIYTCGRWEPADICRDYGGDRIEARDWGRMIHTCRREDVRRREVQP